MGFRAFVASLTARLLRDLGIRGQALRRTINKLLDTTERAIYWLWMKKRDPKAAAAEYVERVRAEHD